MYFAIRLTAVLLAASTGPYYDEIAGACGGVRYDLLEGSTMVNLHAPGSAPQAAPLRGSFLLRELPVGAQFEVFALEHIHWQTPPAVLPQLVAKGSGIYSVLDPAAGGQHALTLNLGVDANTNIVQLVSDWVIRDAPFPTIEITATEYPGSNEQRFQIHVIAEPRRVFLFSTEYGFGSWQPFGLMPVSDGDLLVSNGRRFRTNAQLTQLLGIMPPAPDVGLDAVVLTPATASVLFSMEQDVFSEMLGPLQEGDLINEWGFVFQTNQQLTAAFVPMPPAPDAGLDAVDVAHAVGEFWFSLEEPLFSEALGVFLQPGDVLSEAGYIVRTNAQLLSRFQIIQPAAEGYGLDALHVLPNGVIVFSTETGFIDARFGPISDGDLLSENGHILRRNLEIVRPFNPVEDLDNFGLDGLFVLNAVWAVDADNSSTVDAADHNAFVACLSGPNLAADAGCDWADLNADDRVDLRDAATLQTLLNTP